MWSILGYKRRSIMDNSIIYLSGVAAYVLYIIYDSMKEFIFFTRKKDLK
jgi:hypothetical protein